MLWHKIHKKYLWSCTFSWTLIKSKHTVHYLNNKKSCESHFMLTPVNVHIHNARPKWPFKTICPGLDTVASVREQLHGLICCVCMSSVGCGSTGKIAVTKHISLVTIVLMTIHRSSRLICQDSTLLCFLPIDFHWPFLVLCLWAYQKEHNCYDWPFSSLCLPSFFLPFPPSPAWNDRGK